MAFPAECSSVKPITALANSRTRMMKKSGQCVQHAGQDHRDFDHPRDWAPEVGEELEETDGLLLFDLISARTGRGASLPRRR